MKNQKGFSAVVLLLSLILVVAIGFTGYFVWNTQQNKETKSSVAGNETTNNDETGELKEICLTQEPLCLKYPSNMEASVADYKAGDSSPYPSQKLLINTPSGSSFLIKTGAEGFGGVCEEPGQGETNNIRVAKSEKSTIGENYFVVKVEDTNPTANTYNGKVWLLSTDEQNNNFNPGEILGCAYAWGNIQTLSGLNHTIMIEATNVSDADTDSIFNIFQSIKIGGN